MNDSFGAPVFVVGSPRSGTTLLYSILLSSGEFAVYEAETRLLMVCRAKYGNIKKEKNYNRFINDWIQSKQFFRSGLELEEFKREAEQHRSSYTDFLKFFMESIAKKQGKKRWAEQTPPHLFDMETLSRAFPKAKFIHVIRDGRDVAVSKRKIGWSGTKSANPLVKLLSAAKSWEISVKKGQDNGKKLGDSYIEIHYEDLIKNSDEVLKQISDFAQINIDRDKIKHSSIGSLRKGNTAFNDKMEGLSGKGLGRWKTELTKEEINVLHIAIGETLIELGYELGDFANLHSQMVSWKIKGYLVICPISLNLRRVLKQKTILGRFTSDSIEIGQV